MRLLLFFLLLCNFFSRAQFGQVANVRVQVKDSSLKGVVRNAKVIFVKNDTSFITKNFEHQVKLTKFLSDTIIVKHPELGTAKVPFIAKVNALKEIVIVLPKSCRSLHKTNICPKCKSDSNVIPIVYGVPSKKIKKVRKKGKI
jgi:hypothetical protein